MAEENKPKQAKRVYASGDTLSILRGTTQDVKGRKEYAPEGMHALLNESPITDESWYDDPTMAAMMFLDGVTFGFTDEIAAGFNAAVQSMSGSDKSMSELYQDTVMSMEAERNAYQAKFPEASMALTLAGGLTGGFAGALAKGVAKNVATSALKTSAIAPKATKAISQVTSGLPPSVSGVLAKTGTAAQKTAPFAEMAAVGGLSGVGFAQQGADLNQAAIDGIVSAVTTGTALKFVGKTAKVVSDQRVSRQLRTQEGFRGLSMSDDGSALESIYKGVIKDLPVARGLIAQQNKKYIEPFESKVSQGQAKLNLAKQANNAEKYVANQEKVANELLKKNEKAFASGMTEAAANTEAKIADRMKVNLAARTQKLQYAQQQAEKEFRKLAFDKSMPASLGSKQISSIFSKKSVNEAFAELSDGWTTKGFEVINSRKFRINKNDFVAKMQSKVAKELDDAADLYGLSRKEIDQRIGSFLERNVSPQGWINGSDVSKLRNKISLKSKSFDNAKQQGESILNRKILDQINDIIIPQLTKQNRAKFTADITAYKHFSTLTDAVAAASRTGAKGAFDYKNWLSAVTKNIGTRQFAAGKGVLYKEANDLGSYIAKSEQVIKNAAASAARLEKAKIQSAKNALEAQSKIAAKRQTEAELKNMSESAREYQAIQAKLAKDIEELDRVKQLMPVTNPNADRVPYIWGGGIAALGMFTGNGVSGVLTAASMPVIGKFLGSELGQTIIAGQTQAQQAMARGLQKVAPAAQNLSVAMQKESVRAEAANPKLSEQMFIARAGTESAKAALYRQLSASNELENFRKISGSLYGQIESAWKAQQ